ncbi:guanine nucleotide exchange factor for Rab-3A-like [Copidosoma floridanum]|nr:guanine nucleotide exchange factor for Rab-3A-like [Copidosoma floridanum]
MNENKKTCSSINKPISIFAYSSIGSDSSSRVPPRNALSRRRSDTSGAKTAGSAKSTALDCQRKPGSKNSGLDRRASLAEDKSSIGRCNGEICSSPAGLGSEKVPDCSAHDDATAAKTETQQSSETESARSANKSDDESKIDDDKDDSPPSPSTLQWGRAVAEVKEQAVAKLQEELRRAHEELKLKDEEVARLSRIRQDVEAELEELTASLFQEAHNMVREANQRQATAERLLEESRMKAEVLAAEVLALKTLVLTSTPARPNPHLHPQITCNGGGGGLEDNHNHHTQSSGIFAKKHRRSPSHFNLKYGRENSPPDSPQKENRPSLPYEQNSRDAYERDLDRDRERDGDRDKKRERERDKDSKDLGLEVDPRVHSEFIRWKVSPCVDRSDPFVARIFREDIDLCLDFPNAELGAKVRQAVLDGIIFVEAVSDKAKLGFPKKCALLEAPRQCHYRMRMGDQENQWHSISHICRNRITAVCDFLNYLRYIERGLVKSSVHDVYWEITRLRKEMVLARLGLA